MAGAIHVPSVDGNANPPSTQVSWDGSLAYYVATKPDKTCI